MFESTNPLVLYNLTTMFHLNLLSIKQHLQSPSKYKTKTNINVIILYYERV